MSITKFVARYKDLLAQRDSSNELIKDLLIYCEDLENRLASESQRLVNELSVCQLDLDGEKRSRRGLQQQLHVVERQAEQSSSDLDNLKNRNPYIMVLLDGDGTIFTDNLINQGIDGGKKAASVLRNLVLERYTDLNEDVEVVAKVCANMSGLAAAMKRDGAIDSIQTFKDFTLGFTQGKASFDFIDVGHGKERADSKIKELTRWNLRNHNCRHILLGISHDAGYAPFLDEVLLDNSTAQRISIIQGFPVVRELASTGFEVISFRDLFRSEKLVDRVTTSPTTQCVTPPSSTLFTYAKISGPPTGPSAPTLSMPLAVKNPNQGAVLLRTKTTWILGPRGMDEPLPINPTVLERVRRRVGNTKLCNNHYLRGPCSKGDECCFEHDHKATDEELKAIAFLSRLNPCVSGQDCEMNDCIYGHHCPSTVGGVCSQFNCRYSKNQHPPNAVIKHPKKQLV